MFKKIKVYFSESINEVKNKVFWSSFTDLQNSAILVLVASMVFAIFIGLIDLSFKSTLAWFYKEF